MYPDGGILSYQRRTRTVVDKSSSGNAGNGMLVKDRSCRHGADPPKKERGITFRIDPEPDSLIDKCVSSGNGCSIRGANVSHSGVAEISRRITDTRLLSLSPATTLSMAFFDEK